MSVTHDDVTRAARMMIDVEPPSDLEARIKARVDAVMPAAAPRRWPWAAGLATAAVLTLTAIVSLSRSSGVPEFRSPEVPEFRSAEVQESRSPEVQESRGPVISAPIRLPAYRPMSLSEFEWMARRVPALDLIEPIQPEPVLITPLTMTPLVTPPVFGDPDTGRQ